MIPARDDYNHIQDPHNKIPEDEPVFLLRAQDVLAEEVIRYWAQLNEDQGGDPRLTVAARSQAKKMAAWPKKKMADL